MNSVRDVVKDALSDSLIKKQGLSSKALDTSASESAIRELAADIADSVFKTLGISEEIQDMPADKFLGSSFAMDL